MRPIFAKLVLVILTMFALESACDAASVKMRVRDACRNKESVNYRFFDETNNLVWPATGRVFYTKKENTIYNSNLNCTKGSLICVGGSNPSGTSIWGVGIDNNSACTNCCAKCDGKTHNYSFTCSGAKAAATNSTGNGSASGTGSGASTPTFNVWEQAETIDTLTFNKPRSISTSPSFTLKSQTKITAFTYAQYSASFYALDQVNAQLCMNGAPFSGYLLSANKNETGLYTTTIPAGTYWVCVAPGQSVFDGYSNKIGYEIISLEVTGASTSSNITMVGGYDPGGWQSKGFTFSSGVSAYLEAESTGGAFYIVSENEYKSKFVNGGNLPSSFQYIDTCSGGSSEMECNLKIQPGNYYLVYANTSSDWNGMAAYIYFAK
jgi:hypothetical protein